MDPLRSATNYAADQFTKKKYGAQQRQPGAIPGVPAVPGVPNTLTGAPPQMMAKEPVADSIDIGGGATDPVTDPATGGYQVDGPPVDQYDDRTRYDDSVDVNIPGDSGSYLDPGGTTTPYDPGPPKYDDSGVDPHGDSRAVPVDRGRDAREVEVTDPEKYDDEVEWGVDPNNPTRAVDEDNDGYGGSIDDGMDPGIDIDTGDQGGMDPGDFVDEDPGDGSLIPEDDQPEYSDLEFDEDGNPIPNEEYTRPADQSNRDQMDDWTMKYFDSLFNGEQGSFDPTQELMEEQRDQAARQFSEAMAGRGMSQSGFAAGGQADIYRQSARDQAAAYQQHRQQKVQNQQQAASMMMQDDWKRMDQGQQRAMAELMYELDQKRRYGEEGQMGEYNMQILRDLLGSDNLDAEGKMLLNDMMREWMGGEGFSDTFESDRAGADSIWDNEWAKMEEFFRNRGASDEDIEAIRAQMRANHESSYPGVYGGQE